MAADKKSVTADTFSGRMQTEQIPLSDGQILKLLPIGWTGSAAHILQLARAVEAQHGITAKEGDQK